MEHPDAWDGSHAPNQETTGHGQCRQDRLNDAEIFHRLAHLITTPYLVLHYAHLLPARRVFLPQDPLDWSDKYRLESQR